jgi:hypothetical protein
MTYIGSSVFNDLMDYGGEEIPFRKLTGNYKKKFLGVPSYIFPSGLTRLWWEMGEV